ncbi:MAG: ferritin-like domain-containing protein [Nannocystales bacterium]
MLHGFAHAEQASMLDLRLAARRTSSRSRAAAYLRHADDEARHCRMFTGRSVQLMSQAGRPTAEVRRVHADYEGLFDRLGELDFLAFVHWGEARAIRQFDAYVSYFEANNRQRDATLLRTILVDERRHASYTQALLLELAGDPRTMRRAIGRVRRWELGRAWLRSGRFLAESAYAATMLVLYVLAAPLALLVRIVRPVREGWQPLPAGEDAE